MAAIHIIIQMVEKELFAYATADFTYRTSLRRGRKAPLAKGVLLALSKFYRTGVSLRNFAYDRVWLQTFKSPLPVISVGNIVAGGTGKTPLIRLLLDSLPPECNIALLSRGYRSRIEKSGEVVDLAKTPSSPEVCGDEPYWLSTLFPKTLIGWEKIGSSLLKKRLKRALNACSSTMGCNTGPCTAISTSS